MDKNEEFEKWAYLAYSLEKRKDGNYKLNETRVACAGYEARQPEIDALKAQIRADSEARRTMCDLQLRKICGLELQLEEAQGENAARNAEVMRLRDSGRKIIEDHTERTKEAIQLREERDALEAEVEKLRADAERYRYLRGKTQIDYDYTCDWTWLKFPMLCIEGKPDKNHQTIDEKVDSSIQFDTDLAAMKETK